jgi:selenocysteine lyase/cysteine desulfurase
MGDVWDELRATDFPVARNWAYFDHAAVAPLPRRSGDVLRAWTDEQEQNGVVNWSAWEEKLEAIRDRIASLLSAHRDEIAFVNRILQEGALL